MQQSRRMLLRGLHQSQPLWAQSVQGQPWAGRAVTCPGTNPEPGACPDLPPAGSCSWEMAAVLLDWARPSQHQGMEGYSWECSSLACVLQGLGRRNVWILPDLLRPCSHLHLLFLPVRLDGATWLPRRLHPLGSWKRGKEGQGTPLGAPSQAPGGNGGRELGAFPSTSPGCPSPPSARV